MKADRKRRPIQLIRKSGVRLELERLDPAVYMAAKNASVRISWEEQLIVQETGKIVD
jgi:hypothetical protein